MFVSHFLFNCLLLNQDWTCICRNSSHKNIGFPRKRLQREFDIRDGLTDKWWCHGGLLLLGIPGEAIDKDPFVQRLSWKEKMWLLKNLVEEEQSLVLLQIRVENAAVCPMDPEKHIVQRPQNSNVQWCQKVKKIGGDERRWHDLSHESENMPWHKGGMGWWHKYEKRCLWAF